MNREEFLRTLREALSGEVPPDIIEENVRYYDAYITDEVNRGRSEQEVIEDVAAAGGDAGAQDPYGEAYQESAYRSGAGDSPYGNGSGGENPCKETPFGSEHREHRSFRVYNLDKWYWKLLFWVVIFLIVFIVFNLAVGLASLLWPFLVIGLVIWLVRGLRR